MKPSQAITNLNSPVEHKLLPEIRSAQMAELMVLIPAANWKRIKEQIFTLMVCFWSSLQLQFWDASETKRFSYIDRIPYENRTTD